MPEVPSAVEVPWVSLASGPGGSRESISGQLQGPRQLLAGICGKNVCLVGERAGACVSSVG